MPDVVSIFHTYNNTLSNNNSIFSQCSISINIYISILKGWQSDGYPEVHRVVTEVVMEPREPETPEGGTVPPSSPVRPSPSTTNRSRAPLQELIVNQGDSGSNSKDICKVCHIQYGSEADIDSHWIQCTKACGWWVHARCVGIHYPMDEPGLKALTKWTKNRFFCHKHFPRN